MNVLVLGPDSEAARFNDLDYARMLAQYGGATVHRLDPTELYRAHGMEGMEAAITRLVDEARIEYLFYGLGTEFDFRPEFLHERLARLYRVLILGDDELYFEVSHRYYAQCFDLVLTNNPLVERFHLYGIEALFLPNVFHPDTFPAPSGGVKSLDISFVGGFQGQIGRLEYCQALTAAGLGLEVYGPGSATGAIELPEVVRVYQQSRINLNFTGVVPDTPLTHDLRITRHVRQIKGRCTKIALCGSFILTEQAPGIERLFVPGREIEVFDSVEELLDKSRHYLAHEPAREAMAARAHARALHDYDERVFWPRMVAAIRERAAARPAAAPVCLDRQFWRGFGAWRSNHLAYFLLTWRMRLAWGELVRMLHSPWPGWGAVIGFSKYGLSAAKRAGSLPARWLARLARKFRGATGAAA